MRTINVLDMHECLRKSPGRDLFEILVSGDDWITRFSPRENSFAYSPAIRRQLASILGESNIEVKEMAY